MFCRFCGKSILDDSEFCPYCGRKLEEFQKTDSVAAAEPVRTEDEYYRKMASRIAGGTLIAATKITCYIALGIFLLFNIKMAPSYGWVKLALYVITGVVAIGLVILFQRVILPGNRKVLFIVTLLISVFVIVCSIGLRIVYESKVDFVSTRMPVSGDVLVSLSLDTDFYSYSGEGYVQKVKSSVRIGDSWHDSGDKFVIELGKHYSFRASASYSDAGSYSDSSIFISKDSFSNGKYVITQNVYFSSGKVSKATVEMTLTRCCTFWEVVFS